MDLGDSSAVTLSVSFKKKICKENPIVSKIMFSLGSTSIDNGQFGVT